jgi:disulfide oxidoreductase YuzD
MALMAYDNCAACVNAPMKRRSMSWGRMLLRYSKPV